MGRNGWVREEAGHVHLSRVLLLLLLLLLVGGRGCGGGWVWVREEEREEDSKPWQQAKGEERGGREGPSLCLCACPIHPPTQTPTHPHRRVGQCVCAWERERKDRGNASWVLGRGEGLRYPPWPQPLARKRRGGGRGKEGPRGFSNRQVVDYGGWVGGSLRLFFGGERLAD